MLAGGSEEPAYDCSRFEMRVAERYKDRKSEDNKRIREKFQKVSLLKQYGLGAFRRDAFHVASHHLYTISTLLEGSGNFSLVSSPLL